MKTNIFFEDYLTPEGLQKINKISIIVSDKVEVDINYLEKDTSVLDNSVSKIGKLCEIKMIDRIGVTELSDTLTKDNLRELIELLKKIYLQM